jgi:hypothetical protein
MTFTRLMEGAMTRRTFTVLTGTLILGAAHASAQTTTERGRAPLAYAARATEYWERAQALAPDNWNYHRQEWTDTEGMVGPKYRAKRAGLGDKPYYAPLDIQKPADTTNLER